MKVLLIDDSRSITRVMDIALSRMGHEIIVAYDGIDGFMKAQELQPDVILLDIAMPGISGIEMCHEFRSDSKTKNIPIVILTAHSSHTNVLSALQAGAVDVLVKGDVDMETLRKRIEKARRGAPIFESPAPSAEVPSPEPDSGTEAGLEQLSQEVESGSSPLPTGIEAEPGIASEVTREEPVEVLIDREEFSRRLNEKASIKAFPFVAAEVMLLTADSETSSEQLAKSLSRDPAISAAVLQLANSAIYQRDERIGTLGQAITMLGFSRVRNLAAACALVQNLGMTGSAGGLDRFDFWIHSLAVGVLARWFVYKAGRPGAEEAFMTGLLHDIGKSFFQDNFPDAYAKTLEQVNHTGKTLHQMEKRWLGVSHALIGQRLLDGWKMPTSLSRPVAMHHHSWEKIRSQARETEATAVLVAANQLARALGMGGGGHSVLDEIPQEWGELIGISTAQVLQNRDDIYTEVKELMATFFVHGSEEEIAQAQKYCEFGEMEGIGNIFYLDSSPVPLDTLAVALENRSGGMRQGTRLDEEVFRSEESVGLVGRVRSLNQLDTVLTSFQPAVDAGWSENRILLVLDSDVPEVKTPHVTIRMPVDLNELRGWLQGLTP